MSGVETELLTDTIEAVVTRSDGVELTAALDEFGWLDLLETTPELGVPAVFTAQGRGGSWSAALHDVLAAHAGGEAADLDPTTATVVLPVPRAQATAEARGETTVIDGLCLGPRPTRQWLVVARRDDAGAVTVLRVRAEEATVLPIQGLDPALNAERVHAEVPSTAVDVLARGAEGASWWRTAEASGRRALCHQIAAACAAMLDLALTHARGRTQFGRHIGTFQAVRHKLAEVYVAVAATRSAADAAWDADDLWLAATVAKLVASRACATSVAHTQQVLAGIGFTAEHPYHRVMKHAVALDRILGTAAELAPVVGKRLVSLGDAPRLVEL
jgi:alkylation response protein AidB-like acyl-CoA dehydrogenase